MQSGNNQQYTIIRKLMAIRRKLNIIETKRKTRRKSVGYICSKLAIDFIIGMFVHSKRYKHELNLNKY